MKVICKICGREFNQLGNHLVQKHSIRVAQYIEMFPGSIVISAESSAAYGKAKSGPKSDEHKEKMRATGNLFGHGRVQTAEHMRRLVEINRDRKYESPTEETRKKIRETFHGRYSVEQRQEWAANAGRRSMMSGHRPIINKPEKEILRIGGGLLRFVGDCSFWIRFPNGKRKNPDFVVLPFGETKRVIECYGRHWHRNHNPQDLVDQYASVGIKCLVVWDDEIEAKKAEIIHFMALDELNVAV